MLSKKIFRVLALLVGLLAAWPTFAADREFAAAFRNSLYQSPLISRRLSLRGARSAPRQSSGLLRRCASRNDSLFIEGRWYYCAALTWPRARSSGSPRRSRKPTTAGGRWTASAPCVMCSCTSPRPALNSPFTSHPTSPADPGAPPSVARRGSPARHSPPHRKCPPHTRAAP